jgi:hypothetical protein
VTELIEHGFSAPEQPLDIEQTIEWYLRQLYSRSLAELQS